MNKQQIKETIISLYPDLTSSQLNEITEYIMISEVDFDKVLIEEFAQKIQNYIDRQTWSLLRSAIMEQDEFEETKMVTPFNPFENNLNIFGDNDD